MTGKKENGYLTVYMALVLTVILSLFLSLFEGVRYNTIRMEAECMMQIGLNSVLGEYHRILFADYNLLAVDSSYGTASPGCENTGQHLTDYLERNMQCSEEDSGPLQEVLYQNFLKIKPKNTKVTKVSILTDGRGEIYRREAAEAVRDDVGLTGLDTLLSWVETVEEKELEGRDLAEEKKQISEEIQKIRGKEVDSADDKWAGLLLDNPTDELSMKRAENILGLVLEDTSQLSDAVLYDDGLILQRMKQGQVDEGNLPIDELPEGEALTMPFFFREYLMKYFGCYRREQEGALKYQVEYFISGQKTDPENLENVVLRISSIRDAANLIYLMSDSEKYGQAKALGSAVAVLLLKPDWKDVFTMSLVLSWAFAESLYDVRQIMRGGRIPLMKTAETWHYSLDGILGSLLDDGMDDMECKEGLSYEDYLRLLIAMTDLQSVTDRAMNLTEANIRRTPGNRHFCLDACYTALEAYTEVVSDYGYELEITRTAKY